MKLLAIISCFTLLVACTVGMPAKEVSILPIFHDNSSKVWLIDKVIGGAVEMQSMEMADKSVITFFKNENCELEEIGSFGRGLGKKGMYGISSDNKELVIYTEHETWRFKILPLGEDRILLNPTSDSDYSYAMEIIPYPGN